MGGREHPGVLDRQGWPEVSCSLEGFHEKHDTYEPEKNLSGSKELLAAFKKQRERDIEAAKGPGEAKAKHEAAAEKKNKDREVSQCNAACI